MQIIVTADASAVVLRLKAYPERLRALLLAAMARVSLHLQRSVKEDKLSGQVLHTRTGTLRRSINREVRSSETGVEVIVGTNVDYARAHEYGFSGTVTVKEHLRLQATAFGRPMQTPRQVLVRAHSMRMNIPERSFLRSALREIMPEARLAVAKAVQEAKNG